MFIKAPFPKYYKFCEKVWEREKERERKVVMSCYIKAEYYIRHFNYHHIQFTRHFLRQVTRSLKMLINQKGREREKVCTLAHKTKTRRAIQKIIRIITSFNSNCFDGVFLRKNSVSMKILSLIVVVVVMADLETLRWIL